MIALLIDHLWQSLACVMLLSLFACLTRRNSARLRLWLWRLAALKFALPLALLYGVGRWLGFPVAYTEDQAPAVLVEFTAWLGRWFAPARTAGLEGFAAWGALALLLMVTAGWAPRVLAQWRIERVRAAREALRTFQDPALEAPELGFFKAALLTLCVLAITTAPLLAGAIDDRLWRRELLVANSLSLRNGDIAMQIAAPGMGNRVRIVADESGVLVRNANLRELVALVYGVTRFDIHTDQMTTTENEGEQNHWLYWPRYDVRVTGKVRDPANFDPYALRQIVTKMIAERFGSELHLNGECQPPCGNYGVPLADDPL